MRWVVGISGQYPRREPGLAEELEPQVIRIFAARTPGSRMGGRDPDDVLFFPSTRDEGLGFTMVEVMPAGCAVVTTGSGGAMEIAALADLPLFPRDDPVALSQLLARVVTNRTKVSGIAFRGQKVALKGFSFERMIERWTATLRRLHEEKVAPHASRTVPTSTIG